jgi:putative addiction module component (TIGR02574 family)
MTLTLEQLKASANQLSKSERADLAYYLMTTIAPEPVDDDAAWQAEMDRRADEIRSGKAVGIPVEEVLAELRAKYG